MRFTDPPLAALPAQGPGCSSLLALMTELGPFRVLEDASSLALNPFAWNANATVVFVESPAGVGFSAVAGRTYTTGDNQTAMDALHFVLRFFKAFPELAGHRLLVAGGADVLPRGALLHPCRMRCRHDPLPPPARAQNRMLATTCRSWWTGSWRTTLREGASTCAPCLPAIRPPTTTLTARPTIPSCTRTP